MSAWREAVRAVDAKRGHAAHNVILDVCDPLAGSTRADPRVAIVDDFLSARTKPVATVANTIFPRALYYSVGSPRFIDVFHDRVLPKAGSGKARWSGYYFERMTRFPTADGKVLNPLKDVVERLRNPKVKARRKFELSLFDPNRDVDGSPYGGQCLSHLSFKPEPEGSRERLMLTAMYRNHYYIEKLLGNLIGLGHLLEFVARESGLEVGDLTVVSTYAQIEPSRHWRRRDITSLLDAFDHALSGIATPGIVTP